MNDISYTTEEIAKILRISKLTVYDLIKKGELPAYRVGRQMRVDAVDLEAYKSRAKGTPVAHMPASSLKSAASRQIIISGQDVSLDMLANHIEGQTKSYRPLRSYVGSLNSLIAMYQGDADVVSTHLFDGDTGEYNIPYIRKLLIGHRYVVMNLLSRWAGFYVQPGNPKQICTWSDLQKPGIKMVNREKGSGTRVLLEEQLRLHGISSQSIAGYEHEEANHLGVAGAVATGEADVGIGIEKAAYLVGVEFVPLMKERYDLVMLRTPQNEECIRLVSEILRSASFQGELAAVGGYDVSQTGHILYEE
ncbi:helix-turn-helix transcriptional regulator [Brevibacillus massiliensis]|jgi:putative molybdopterin biosynthesis protein|uniref:helix-turn-helix transcriptional regulator n=1 Tax=Brevibacillus massiliensis TaxID=1118054 RepID=UPI000300FCF6|nr:helix-turn-helix transcriptional regulator [Brevibacillus massiliensis]